MTIKIVTANEADVLLKDPDFRGGWDKIYKQCPWATPFQSVGFVMTWYEIYHDRYDPVIVSQFAPDGELIGLLTLAVSSDSKQLVVAGAHQAEYQVWLADLQYGNSFIENAIKKLHEDFPEQLLVFMYLPPWAPTEWTNPDQLYGQYCMLEAHRRPLMVVGDGSQISASLRKKSNKSRFNRLKRLGEVRFEQIKDTTGLTSVFDEIISYYDFRQGAINNSYPFQSDSLKKSFHFALLKIPDLLHVTVLRVGDNIAAAHLGVYNKNEIYLGIFAQNPFFAKHSPGKFHLLLLGQEIAKQDFSALDLTPGGDPWKERFATDHDEVHILTVFPNRKALIQLETRRKLTNLAKQMLQLLRINPQSVKNFVAKFRCVKGYHLFSQLFKKLWHKTESRLYVVKSEDVSQFEYPRLMSKNRLDELLITQPTKTGQARQDFMTQALKRIEKGYHVYTCVENGQLVFYGWLMEHQGRIFLPEVEQEFCFPPGSAFLFDFYTHPKAEGRDLYQSSLRQILHDVVAMPDTKQVYVAVPSDNKHLRHAIEEVGFTYECSLFKK